MKRFFSPLFFILVLLSTAFAQTRDKFELHVNNSDYIIEGKVVSQQTFWNADSSAIFTENEIEISKIFKGSRRL